jgi:hypothetical protein
LLIGIASMAERIGGNGREAHAIAITRSSAALPGLLQGVVKRLGDQRPNK